MRIREGICMCIAAAVGPVSICGVGGDEGARVPDIAEKIRPDHPRLFFNTETLPEIRDRALNEASHEFERLTLRLEDPLAAFRQGRMAEMRNYGRPAAWSAFAYLVTGEPKYLELAEACIERSLEFYEWRYQNRRSVDWQIHSRVHLAMAWDWLYNELSEPKRTEYMTRLIRVIHNVVHADPPIPREHLSHYAAGMYGLSGAFWPIGVTAYGTGIEPEIVAEWVSAGHEENLRMLRHRSKYAGNDGGGASPTLLYSAGAYPYADWTFYYTMLSATGMDIRDKLWHNALKANYLLWNYLPSSDLPRHFGYGDSHMRDGLAIQPITHLHVFTHLSVMKNIFGDLFGTRYPDELLEAAAQVKKMIPEEHRDWSDIHFIYPFLIGQSRAPLNPPRVLDFSVMPRARHFAKMGQVFMSSGFDKEDTFLMFACGGDLEVHRHFDDLHFTIYSNDGFLAIDSGSRIGAGNDKSHLVNYYSQTVAHNSLLIHQPGEPRTKYWGSQADLMYGGQHSRDSRITAFETNESFVYVAGDATKSYFHGASGLPEKVDLVTRQIVFLPPSHFIIFDRVTSTDPSYRKTWLLHTLDEPQVEEGQFVVDHGKSRMFGKTLLPKDAMVSVIGGAGKEFWAGGRNWAVPGPERSDDLMEMAGRWRIEVEPGEERREDHFLHLFEVTCQSVKEMGCAKLVEVDQTVGVELEIAKDKWTVLFNKTGELGGKTIRNGDSGFERELTREVQPQAGVYDTPRMTREEAISRIPERDLPAFRMIDLDRIEQYLDEVVKGKVFKFGESAGGRPLYVVTYGEKERGRQLANFNSAIGAGAPYVYANKKAREKPVIFFKGPVHGHELEGLVGLMNLIHIMETGSDLRGKDYGDLQALGEKCRLVIVPYGNPDGIARFVPGSLVGMRREDMRFWGQGTWGDDTIRVWPEGKRQHPMRPENCGFLGCYYNDHGINLMHDDFFLPMSQEVPALLALAREEAPDIAVSLHSAGGGPALVTAAYAPEYNRKNIKNLAADFDLAMKRKFNIDAPSFRERFELNIPSFNLTSALYHVSGANSFTFECPQGIIRENFPNYTVDDLLDMQILLYKTMMNHVLKN